MRFVVGLELLSRCVEARLHLGLLLRAHRLAQATFQPLLPVHERDVVALGSAHDLGRVEVNHIPLHLCHRHSQIRRCTHHVLTRFEQSRGRVDAQDGGSLFAAIDSCCFCWLTRSLGRSITFWSSLMAATGCRMSSPTSSNTGCDRTHTPLSV